MMKFLARVVLFPVVAVFGAMAGICVAVVWAFDPNYDSDAAFGAFSDMMSFTEKLLH